jgi:hypothetical protein
MKRNLTLFSVFIILLVVTFFFQEKRTEREHTESHEKDLLIKEEISHLKLPGVEAEKKNNQWWSGKEILSHNTFKQIEKKLSEIKKVKDIKGEWKSYFPNPLLFQINHVNWAIGDLSLDKQAFYISRDKDIYLAYIEGESTHLTQNEEEIESIKLNELVTLMSKSISNLKETQLFRYFPDLPMEKVVVKVEGSLPFELNFDKNTTLPPPIKGISVHKELRGKFYSLLTQATIKEELPYDENLKFKKLGEMTFLNTSKTEKWQLWLRSDKSADAIIIDPLRQRAFLMIGGTLKLFFVNIQDYWDKKVIPQEYFVSFSRLEASFTQDEKSARVIIINKEPFDFESSKYKIDKLKMEQLLQFIFNLGPKDQAERVSHLSTSEKKQLLSESHLRIQVMEQELILWRKTEELIVANLTQGFKVHFTMLDENFRGTFEDVLK